MPEQTYERDTFPHDLTRIFGKSRSDNENEDFVALEFRGRLLSLPANPLPF